MDEKMLYGVEGEESLWHKTPQDAAEWFFEFGNNGDYAREVIIVEYQKNELDFSPEWHLERIEDDLNDCNTFHELYPVKLCDEAMEAWDNFVAIVERTFPVSLYSPTGKKFLFKFDGDKVQEIDYDE